MNEDKMIEVLVRIEQEQAAFKNGAKDAVGFNMNTWYASSNTCGTTACLAGHAALMEGYDPLVGTDMVRDSEGHVRDVEEVACEALGLTSMEGFSLFYLEDLHAVYRSIATLMGVDVQVLHDKVQGAA